MLKKKLFSTDTPTPNPNEKSFFRPPKSKSEMAKDPVGTIVFDHVEGVDEACAEDNRRLL